MLESFAQEHPEIQIQAVLADALYGNAKFMDKAAKVTRCPRVISQLRKNQLVRSKAKGKKVALVDYFSRNKSVDTQLIIRGGEEKSVTMLAARVIVIEGIEHIINTEQPKSVFEKFKKLMEESLPIKPIENF